MDFLDQLIGNTEETLILGQVSKTAQVLPGAVIDETSKVSGRAFIEGSVRVLEGAKVGGYARVLGNTILRGNVRVGGFAVILGGEWTTGLITEGLWREPGVAGSSKTESPRYKNNRFRECWSCGIELDTDNQAPVVKNEIWFRCFPKTWIVCRTCLKKKLGRNLREQDLIDSSLT